LQICLAYSCTTYQQMFDGLSGSSLNTMKMATLTNLSSYPSNYYSLKKILKAIGYQLSAVHLYDIQVFIAKSLPNSVYTFLALVVTHFTVLQCQESGYVRSRRSSLCPRLLRPSDHGSDSVKLNWLTMGCLASKFSNIALVLGL
ncbi:hypothetical protein Bpfe_012286, partial [Biomphalaria pfeifferi]